MTTDVDVVSIADGRYFLRVGNTRQPVLGDDVLWLANEPPGYSISGQVGRCDQSLSARV